MLYFSFFTECKFHVLVLSNHEAMRQVVGKLNPPYILYLPLILKGNTDTADGKLMHFITATFHLSH